MITFGPAGWGSDHRKAVLAEPASPEENFSTASKAGLLVWIGVWQSGTVVKGLGDRIRQERKARRLRLQEIADRSGLTPSFLSQVERDIAKPSLSSLALIAAAIGVDLPTLLPSVSGVPVSARGGARVPFGPDPGRIVYERLSVPAGGGQLNALKLRVAPGYHSEVSSHDGEEFVYVLSGQIRYVVDGAIHDLGPDDALQFSSRHIHHVQNVSDLVAEYVSVGTFNIFGKINGTAGAGLPVLASKDPID